MKVDKPTLSQLYDCYGELLTQKQRDCFELWCNQDDTLAEIYDAVRRAEQQLLRFEEVTGCLARERRDRLAADRLQSLSDRLREAVPAELPELAGSLTALADSLR